MARAGEVDAIRGLALLGICVVNVPFLAQPLDRMLERPVGADLVAQIAVEWLFQGKFFVLFSFLFGWGFAIQMAAAARAGVLAWWSSTSSIPSSRPRPRTSPISASPRRATVRPAGAGRRRGSSSRTRCRTS